MADIKWIKLTTNMFDDEKIKIIQSMPEGDALLVVWIRLIMLAGKTNDMGYVYISENIPYTEDMLATIFSKPVNIIRLALTTFQKFGMIEVDESGIYIINFEKHQNIDGLEKIREQNRLRKAKQREKQKLSSGNSECHVSGHEVSRDTSRNVTQQNKNKKENKNINILSGANAPDQQNVICFLPLNDNTEFPVYKEQVEEWADLYPAVAVIQQIKNMRGWLLANPKRRKTRSGISRFINNWLSKEQDKPHTAQASETVNAGYEGVNELP